MALNKHNWLVLVMALERVYCAVRTGPLSTGLCFFPKELQKQKFSKKQKAKFARSLVSYSYNAAVLGKYPVRTQRRKHFIAPFKMHYISTPLQET